MLLLNLPLIGHVKRVILDFWKQLSEVLHNQWPVCNHDFSKADSILKLRNHRLISFFHFLNLHAELFFGCSKSLDLLLKSCKLCIFKFWFCISKLFLYPLDFSHMRVIISFHVAHLVGIDSTLVDKRWICFFALLGSIFLSNCSADNLL